MKYVLDSCVGLKWLIRRTDRAGELRAAHRRRSAQTKPAVPQDCAALLNAVNALSLPCTLPVAGPELRFRPAPGVNFPRLSGSPRLLGPDRSRRRVLAARRRPVGHRTAIEGRRQGRNDEDRCYEQRRSRMMVSDKGSPCIGIGVNRSVSVEIRLDGLISLMTPAASNRRCASWSARSSSVSGRSLWATGEASLRSNSRRNCRICSSDKASMLPRR
jgi:hypothetical protein